MSEEKPENSANEIKKKQPTPEALPSAQPLPATAPEKSDDIQEEKKAPAAEAPAPKSPKRSAAEEEAAKNKIDERAKATDDIINNWESIARDMKAVQSNLLERAGLSPTNIKDKVVGLIQKTNEFIDKMDKKLDELEDKLFGQTNKANATAAETVKKEERTEARVEIEDNLLNTEDKLAKEQVQTIQAGPKPTGRTLDTDSTNSSLMTIDAKQNLDSVVQAKNNQSLGKTQEQSPGMDKDMTNPSMGR